MQVYCRFINGVAITEVLHDSEVTVKVQKCQEIGCFKHPISYQIPMPQMAALVSLSHQCEQDIRFGCLLAPLHAQNNELGGWKDIHGNSNSNQAFRVTRCGHSEQIQIFKGEMGIL